MSDDTDWTLISFEPKKKTVAAPVAAVKLSACPKCGKKLGRGGHFHARRCTGVLKEDIK